jgi:hypothetical protein
MICNVCGKEYEYNIENTPDIEIQEALKLHACHDCGIDIAKYIVKRQMVNTAKKIGVDGVYDIMNRHPSDKVDAMALFWEMHDEMYNVDPARKEEKNDDIHPFETMSNRQTLGVVKSVIDEDLRQLHKSRIEEIWKEVNEDETLRSSEESSS